LTTTASKEAAVRPQASLRKLAFAFSPAHTQNVFTKAHLDHLHTLCDVVEQTPLRQFDDAQAASVLAETEILVTGWGSPRVDRKVLELAPRLRLIAHSAGTVKSLIAPEVFEAGILVCNAASANAVPVAEFTLAAILFSNKQVLRYRDMYRQKRESVKWERLSNPAVGNWRKTIGLVGMSRIGRRVVELLAPHDLCVIGYDPYVNADEGRHLGIEMVELDDLMRQSDVVSLHAPALESTRHMIDARRLALMHDDATIINTARGMLIDQQALEKELVSGRLNAVIDVTVPENLPADSPLYDLPNVLLTPHIAGALGVERERLGALVIAEIERYLRGLPLAHAISADTLHLQA
jgi:phosphoglycerate dehydrogenase-like enzyme